MEFFHGQKSNLLCLRLLQKCLCSLHYPVVNIHHLNRRFIFSFPKYHIGTVQVDTMCQVSATRYSRCQCVCRFRAEQSCEAGFSSSQLSCKEGKNVIMKVAVAPQPICFQCHDKMQTLLRAKYTSEAQTIFERGRMEKWTDRRIKGEVKRKLKVGSSEIARLGVVCGTTLPDPPA